MSPRVYEVASVLDMAGIHCPDIRIDAEGTSQLCRSELVRLVDIQASEVE